MLSFRSCGTPLKALPLSVVEISDGFQTMWYPLVLSEMGTTGAQEP